MTLPPKFSSNVPYLGPLEAIMFAGPVYVRLLDLPRYILNPDRVVATNPDDSQYVLENHTFALVVFPGSTYLPDYPEHVAEAFRDNDYYNPPEYVPWGQVMN